MIIKKAFITALFTLLMLLMAAMVWHYQNPLPPIYPHGPATRITASDQMTLRAFGDKLGVHRYHVQVSEVDEFYLNALLHYEDRWFYYHYGVNPLALARAAVQWIVHGQIISGGSTLTMQVARLIDPHDRTIMGKLHQIGRAIQLEWYYSKQDILSFYLNLAPFGGNIEGIGAASLKYFGKHPKHLNKNEAALLVVIPQKPSRFRPDRDIDLAKNMRNKVLNRLQQGHLIDAEQYQLFAAEPIKLYDRAEYPLAPLLSRYLRNQSPLSHTIKTTVDYELQVRLSRLLHRVSTRLPHRASAAALVVDNHSAQVIAYQGSVDFNDLSRFAHVDMVRAIRSPGSTLKPFIYGQAIDMGLIHSKSLLSDIPSDFKGYKPQNLNGHFSGAISAEQALQKSLNVPAVQLLNRITPARFDANLRAANIQLVHEKANLSVGLGGTGTNLLNLAKLYGALASHGEVKALQLRQPHHLPTPQLSPDTVRILSPQSSWIVFKMLSSQSAPDRVVPSTRREIAWKTGTSYGYRDFWSVGVSPDYTVAVWVGRPDSSPMLGYLGATQAAPIMFDIFDLLPKDQRTLSKPEGVEQTLICWPSGRAISQVPQDQCVEQHQALTINGMTPPSMDLYGDFNITSQWPAKLTQWLITRKGLHPIETPDEVKPSITITSLRNGQHYYRSQLDVLPLASSRPKETQWFINHRPISQSQLSLRNYQGKTVVSACINTLCDKKTIYIHP
ncbi:penicillin-binding protein 1C [Pseudoalteromonas sp. SMS1]|uniref:penicillin-binding protein 1C n=1 Tax=Pseudoalteromonas sp. SMS1 TaxID=2908894 RepID=UPI001F312106|nr:penicillin-binding protein 1C [Pseudoalteromonas sp. SMS1]MCF2856740.1 penicillin-binding protein 1C [Pseudoalteromonas sp. SMS1]